MNTLMNTLTNLVNTLLGKDKEIHKEPRMYVIVRGELSETYRLVQGAHALAQFSLEHHEEFLHWNNSYLIFLKVFNLNELRDFKNNKLNDGKVPFSVFREPDLDNQMTAIALYDTGEVVKGLKLA